MFKKTRRYLAIGKVFLKYNLFSLLYKDIRKNYISNRGCSCSLDTQYRSNAAKLRVAFEELGPTFIKLGQAMSKRPDLIPQTYVVELEKLQDRVKPLDFEKMRGSFESECICGNSKGRNGDSCYQCNDILDQFDEFDTNPIASASIGQVYRGVLNGKNVAVKIARPNLIDTINLDLEIIDDLKPLFMRIVGTGKNFSIDQFLEEFKEMLRRELDYRIEAINLKHFRDNFMDFDGVNIPDVYMDYTSESILVMDFVEGTQIKDLTDADKEKRSLYARLVSSSYLKQVYIDGFYHADPHGGNIIVQDDSISYIDFGAVGKIDGEIRKNMLYLFYGIYKKNVDLAAESFLKLGNIEKEDIDVHRFKWDMDDLISQQQYGYGMRQSDNYAKLALKYDISLPGEFATLERALVLIESVCLDLDPDYNLLDEVGPLIFNAIKQRYSPRKLAEDVKLEADDYLEIIKNFPGGVDDVIETIRGYRIDRLKRRTDTLRRYRLLDDVSKNVFLTVIAVSSVYMIVNVDGYLSSLGVAGFIGALLVGLYSLMRS